jgi:signal transduction histidine kinase
MHLRVLERVADGMTELVENLLDVTRFERGIIPLHRRTIVLQDLLMDVVSVQYPEAERKGLNLHTDIIDDPIHVSVDPQRLSQVFTNLMTNAINYTSEGGTIIIKLDRSGDRAVFQISDTGIGIAPEMLEHVFDPFFRANEGSATGTGLGLTIAKEIVDLHSGDLRVDSEVGRGSTFTVKLGIVTE